jgi:hypothetical protein
VAGHAPLILRVTKEALLRLQERMTPDQTGDLILTCYMSRDFREGMDAFLNKRYLRRRRFFWRRPTSARGFLKAQFLVYSGVFEGVNHGQSKLVSLSQDLHGGLAPQ